MGRSQRARRDPRRYNEDSRGSVAYPSNGEFLYDWASTWPSGSRKSNPTVNPTASYGGVTLTVTLLPGVSAVVTAVGDTTVSATGTLGLDATLDDGTRVVRTATFTYGDVATAAAVVTVIAIAVNALPGFSGGSVGTEATCNLVGTGTIHRAVLVLTGP